MAVLDKLSAVERRNLLNFVAAHKHDSKINEIAYFAWTREAMQIVAPIEVLSGEEKKCLVEDMYHQLAEEDTNEFGVNFDIGGCIEFTYSTAKEGLQIAFKPGGCRWKCFGSSQPRRNPSR